MKLTELEVYFREHGKLVGVLVFILGIVSLSGFFMGMRQTDDEVVAYRQPVKVEEYRSAEFPPAPKYSEIQDSGMLANAQWKFDLRTLRERGTMPDHAKPLDADELAAVLKERSERRAFSGAPPTIPHEIPQLSSASCMTCHGPDSKVQISGVVPSQISHPYLANCTQCHVPADGLRQFTEDERSRLVVANDFDGLLVSGRSTRAFVGAPPTIPHALWMRQNCMSCHGPGRQNAIRTSHPARGSCLQCHAPNAELDNRERVPWSPPTP